jgi:thiamine-phosphate pyrophosphorylase
MARPMNGRDLYGLYAITDGPYADVETLVRKVDAAIEGGARIVQYRDKGDDRPRRECEARALAGLCRDRGVPLLINDDVELALASGADGVHVGRDDMGVSQARARLPAGALVGCSCYDRFDLAKAAVAAGADYVAFGSFFASPTKPHAVRASLDLLHRTLRELGRPAVAIGGITPENGAALVAAGAQMLAVISAVFAAPDITAAARAFAPCFTEPEDTAP